MKSKYTILTIALFALMIVMGTAVSLASAWTTGTFSLSVTSGPAGTVTRASAGSGSGWHGGATVTLKWDDGVTVLGSTSTNGAGKWSVDITIPSSAAAGTHTITANDAQGTSGTTSFTVTVSAVTMTVSYHVNDGTTPSAAPVFHYKDTAGVSKTYTLTGSAHSIINVGAGLAWSVDNPIGSGYERWSTATASGNAPASGASTTVFNYYHQYQVPTNYSTSDSSTPSANVVLSGASLGSALPTTNLGTSVSRVWLDAGSFWSVNTPITSGSQRWDASSGTSGTVSSTTTIAPSYYHQLNVHYVTAGNAVDVSVPSDEWVSSGSAATGSFPSSVTNTGDNTKSTLVSDDRPSSITEPVTVTATYTNQFKVHYVTTGNILSVTVPDDEWVSANGVAVGIFPASVSNSPSDTRCNFVSDDRPTAITAPVTVTATYQTQYQLTVSSIYGSPTGAGWYNAGDSATFSVTTPDLVDSGTQNILVSWSGTGTGAYSGSSVSSTITMNNAITETASWKTRFKVTFNVAPSGGGTSTPATSAWYDADSSLNSLSAAANGGYTFTSWTKTGSITLADSTLSSTTFSLTGPGAITANFQSQAQPIQTQISIMYTPPSDNPAEPITLTGKLTVASDYTVGVPNREVTLSYFDGENWNTITTTTTGTDGSYSVRWTLPADIPNGPQLVKAVFSGDPQETSPQYLGSESVANGIGIMVLPEYPLGGIIAFAISFGAFVAFKVHKNRSPKTTAKN